MASLTEKIAEADAEAKRLKDQIKQLKIEKHTTDISKMSKGQEASYSEPRPRRVLHGHFGKVYAMHWATDSLHLVSASQDGNMIIWDGNSARKEHAIPLRSSWVMTCAYGQCAEDNPDPSSLVACGGLDNVLSVYDVNKDVNRPVSELSGHEGYLSCCRFIGESKVLTASGDAKCIYWDLDRETQTSTFDEHSMDVMCVAVSPTDKNMFASGSVDETMKVWDIRSGKCTHTFGRKGDKFHTSDINSVAFFPEGWSIGTGSDDSTCRIFDIRCYGQLSNFEVPNTGIAVTSVAFSKSGRLLFAGYDDNKCHAWDLFGDAEQPSCVMREHSARISCLGVTPNGHALCTGSWDTHLRIWA